MKIINSNGRFIKIKPKFGNSFYLNLNYLFRVAVLSKYDNLSWSCDDLKSKHLIQENERMEEYENKYGEEARKLDEWKKTMPSDLELYDGFGGIPKRPVQEGWIDRPPHNVVLTFINNDMKFSVCGGNCEGGGGIFDIAIKSFNTREDAEDYMERFMQRISTIKENEFVFDPDNI